MKLDKIIYIVDDDEDDRLLLKESITSVIPDATIREACDGADFVDQITMGVNSGQIVVLMDMNMPRMNGLEALTILKSIPDLAHIPVILISTASDREQVKNAYDNGINAYVKKPFKISEYEDIAKAVAVCFLNDYPAFDNPVAAGSLSAKTILVIDDNADQSNLINLALKNCLPNAQILSAADQSTALDLISSRWLQYSKPPDMILLDLYLPERANGLALLKIIKDFLILKNLMTIPVIVLSHSSDADDVRDCYRYQANAFMSKNKDLTMWFSFFSLICHFWMNTIITHNKA
ncbi:response regulator [Dyadobacter sp. CY356]|uniref:response regulator n=1 Tax=Dyadobacter sp. CY356 TaxID=2906442 RepID=UPI001F18BF14|nr:response regulator [Dyadobacter sp. CY356]MCF0055064.1 response regulator [Dyadobacter sp. CY356]